jgi:hypothetical protein
VNTRDDPGKLFFFDFIAHTGRRAGHQLLPRLIGRLALCLGVFLCGLSPATQAADSPFLWQVKGTRATHYLQGSMHLLPPGASELPAALEVAYAAAEGLVFESDLEALSAPEMQSRMLDAAKEAGAGGLSARIPPELYAKLEQRAAEWELSRSLCDAYKAWFCAMTLEVLAASRAGFEPKYGLDARYYERARRDDKTIEWLESPQQQMTLFSGMPEPLSAQFLASTLDALGDTGFSPESLLRTWQAGDLAAMDQLVLEFSAHYPGAYGRLLAERNRAWLPRLAGLLRSDQPQLVIVGAAHFPGPDGLLALLKACGFELVPVAEVAAATPADKDSATPLPSLAP